MNTFDTFNLNKQLGYGLADLGFEHPTPIQEKAFSVVLSGKDVVGIAQTGTGKTLAYVLPILQDLKFSKQVAPRVLILVPTRELVLQVVENIQEVTGYIDVRVLGVFGGTNINTQKQEVAQGCDILVATPGRLQDLALTHVLKLKAIKKLVVDEVDVMLDLGFRHQLINIFDLLPERRQNILFSATMTEEVDELIEDFFQQPERISVALSGTPLENIQQTCYAAPNFYSKLNLLTHLLKDKDLFHKVVVFTASKKQADSVFEFLEDTFGTQLSIIHANKSQNFRINALEDFNSGKTRILIATDVIARGLDLDGISHVINLDTPAYPENYIHRIGRTGRAKQEGHSVLFYTEKEEEHKLAIEVLMDLSIEALPWPEEVEVSTRLSDEERHVPNKEKNPNRNLRKKKIEVKDEQKKEKNQKVNDRWAKQKRQALKYKKPKTRGDKNQNKKKR